MEMIPSVVANLVAMLRDGFGAIDIPLRPVSRDEERAVHMRPFQTRNQVLEAFRVRAGIKGERDL